MPTRETRHHFLSCRFSPQPHPSRDDFAHGLLAKRELTHQTNAWAVTAQRSNESRTRIPKLAPLNACRGYDAKEPVEYGNYDPVPGSPGEEVILMTKIGEFEKGHKFAHARVNYRTGMVQLFEFADNVRQSEACFNGEFRVPAKTTYHNKQYARDVVDFLRRGHSLLNPQCRCKHDNSREVHALWLPRRVPFFSSFPRQCPCIPCPGTRPRCSHRRLFEPYCSVRPSSALRTTKTKRKTVPASGMVNARYRVSARCGVQTGPRLAACISSRAGVSDENQS